MAKCIGRLITFSIAHIPSFIVAARPSQQPCHPCVDGFEHERPSDAIQAARISP
jgi:hypothetical protein